MGTVSHFAIRINQPGRKRGQRLHGKEKDSRGKEVNENKKRSRHREKERKLLMRHTEIIA